MPISAQDRYEAARSAMETEATQDGQIRATLNQMQQDMEAHAAKKKAERKGKGGSPWGEALGSIGKMGKDGALPAGMSPEGAAAAAGAAGAGAGAIPVAIP